VLYVELRKALYGTLHAALLFWRMLTNKLKEWGFKSNPYNWCVANKMVNGKQWCTIFWHVDDLKISYIILEIRTPYYWSVCLPFPVPARTFVSAYMSDIRVTPQGNMKGIVWIQSQAKFPNIKKNNGFSEWLNGSTTSPTSPRIELKLLVLTGGTRIFATGIFLNIVTRFDLVQNFQDQIWNALATTVDKSEPIPEFQIEIFHAHGKTGRTRLYRMATSSVECANILNTKMMQIMPSPSADILYIKYKVWDLLRNSKKTAYYDMQKSFADNHGEH
jgi:hypothetical protein